MNRLFAACALVALAACSPRSETADKAAPVAAADIKPATTTAPPGVYKLDPAHTSVNFRINHLGMSFFTARFTRIGGTLTFDPANPANSSVDVTIDANSLQTNYPDPTIVDFDKQISGPEFLDAPQFPKITFKSTRVELTGPNTANVTGDFTLHGVTKPIVIAATFNNGYPPGPMDPEGARIGFSGHTRIKRSDFGISMGIPAPGTTMGVGDEIDIQIESEWTKK